MAPTPQATSSRSSFFSRNRTFPLRAPARSFLFQKEKGAPEGAPKKELDRVCSSRMTCWIKRRSHRVRRRTGAIRDFRVSRPRYSDRSFSCTLFASHALLSVARIFRYRARITRCLSIPRQGFAHLYPVRSKVVLQERRGSC